MSTPKISILMSTYNETESDIRESVESMLRQTFTDYEMIVVNDNPKREDVKAILDSYNDSRIIFYQNPTNIGLAMSMNKAAELASKETNIFARMDSDDIAEPTRLQKNYDVITSGDYDFVCSRYSYIDEKSVNIRKNDKQVYYKPELLHHAISLDPSIVHHPTVMFTREIFEKTGGYRDFPCSQDADLWLRMAENGCRFYMIDEELVRYRINPNSVSNKKWFQQQLTCNYIFELSMERIRKNGHDSYSIDNYKVYLKEHGAGDITAENRLRNTYKKLGLAQQYRNEGKLLIALFLRITAFVESPLMRKHYIQLKKKSSIIK